MARRIQNIDPKRVSEDGVIYRGVNVGGSAVLLDRCDAAQSTWTGPRVHFGTVITSNTVVGSQTLVAQLREQFPDAIAGEMEAAGVYGASTRHPKPEWIMVKAISDFSQGKGRTEGFQPVAARNAADFVTHMIASGELSRKRPASDSMI